MNSLYGYIKTRNDPEADSANKCNDHET